MAIIFTAVSLLNSQGIIKESVSGVDWCNNPIMHLCWHYCWYDYVMIVEATVLKCIMIRAIIIFSLIHFFLHWFALKDGLVPLLNLFCIIILLRDALKGSILLLIVSTRKTVLSVCAFSCRRMAVWDGMVFCRDSCTHSDLFCKWW